MTFYEKLIDLSFRLYDINSNIEIHVSADNINVFDGDKELISLWVQNGRLYPKVDSHNYSPVSATDLDTVLEILNIIKEFDE